MDEQIIKISIEQFRDIYNSVDVPRNILDKALDIKNTYSCFNSYYDPKMIWAKKIYNNNKEKYNKPKVKSRFHIIIPDFTKKSELKRCLIGNLNKLSIKNRDSIYEKIKEIIAVNDNNDNKDDIFMIIWNYVKTSDDELYSNILALFDKEYVCAMLDKLWNNYINNKEWDPPRYIYENNLLVLNDEYDMYCEYTKWKRGINNINKIWIKYKREELLILLNNIADYVVSIVYNTDIYKYILDILLEQLYKILAIAKYNSIIDKIKNINIKNLDNSTKFFIYNIIEL
jgi:hypothetical protein